MDHPKPREIFAAAFEDRLVHHLIVAPLEQLWEPKLSSSSYACRRGKGPLKALVDIQYAVRSLSQGGKKEVFALHLDIKSFFVTIDRRGKRCGPPFFAGAHYAANFLGFDAGERKKEVRTFSRTVFPISANFEVAVESLIVEQTSLQIGLY